MKHILLSAFLYIMSFHVQSQNVGIGIATPIAKLEVMNPGKSTVRISSTNYADTSSLVLSNRTLFGAGTDFILSSNQETGLNISTASDIAGNVNPSILFLNPQGNVGIGNASPLNKLDVGGSINISGALKVGGNPGTARQSLVSNGSSAPSWQNSALSNSTRFSVNIPAFPGDGFLVLSTIYNTNTTDITIISNGVTINRTGLYHLEGIINATSNYAAPQTYAPRLAFGIQLYPGVAYNLLYGALTTLASSTQYLKTERFSIDLYITSGTTLSLSAAYSFGSTNSTSGWFNGYLISD